jgi:hypothetical protein
MEAYKEPSFDAVSLQRSSLTMARPIAGHAICFSGPFRRSQMERVDAFGKPVWTGREDAAAALLLLKDNTLRLS